MPRFYFILRRFKILHGFHKNRVQPNKQKWKACKITAFITATLIAYTIIMGLFGRALDKWTNTNWT